MEKQNLDIHEQMSEFMTTNGDVYILPYLNKFDKLNLSQGKHSQIRFIFSNIVFSNFVYKSNRIDFLSNCE